jgi:signal transduction histidine kinase
MRIHLKIALCSLFPVLSGAQERLPGSLKAAFFQPFFTTKPTGQGTGLALSMAYDIIRAHGGELKVETEEGKETEFIIALPIV